MLTFLGGDAILTNTHMTLKNYWWTFGRVLVWIFVVFLKVSGVTLTQKSIGGQYSFKKKFRFAKFKKKLQYDNRTIAVVFYTLLSTWWFFFSKIEKTHTFFTKTNKPTSNPQTQPQRDWEIKSSLEWIHRTTMGCWNAPA